MLYVYALEPFCGFGQFSVVVGDSYDIRPLAVEDACGYDGQLVVCINHRDLAVCALACHCNYY